jgi:serine/threonine-protein kinase/endoribonuclease IRE1
VPATTTPEPEAAQPPAEEPRPVESTPTEEYIEQTLEREVEKPKLDPPFEPEPREKKIVTFSIPDDDDDDDLSPLSRTTTADQGSPIEEVEGLSTVNSNADASTTPNGVEGSLQDPTASPATPKKKKTHRGKRGGRKLNKNQQKDEDEVGRIVDAAKQLDPAPGLHPDEITMNGDDMQDVTNIKRIGKLTIDQDRLLGNGSGGTFVFEGKWNVSILHVRTESI